MKAIALIGLIALAGCSAQATGRSAPAMRTFVNPPAKLSAQYPRDWHATHRQISHVLSPKQRFAAATFPLRRWTAPQRFPAGEAL
ncbi:MAG: hypothetical protein ACJ76V_15245, partial [Thermoleophilaceae bacterium]